MNALNVISHQGCFCKVCGLIGNGRVKSQCTLRGTEYGTSCECQKGCGMDIWTKSFIDNGGCYPLENWDGCRRLASRQNETWKQNFLNDSGSDLGRRKDTVFEITFR